MPLTSEQERLARRWFADGLNHRQIARDLGVSHWTTMKLLRPDLYEEHLAMSRDAKRKRKGRCVDCGAETSYNGHGVQVSARCHPCSALAKMEWPPERIIACIQAYAREHGRPPSARDWHRAAGRGPDNPSVFRVQQRFGSWANAIEAAGFPRPGRGMRYDRATKTAA